MRTCWISASLVVFPLLASYRVSSLALDTSGARRQTRARPGQYCQTTSKLMSHKESKLCEDSQKQRICVLTDDDALIATARTLAGRLSIPYVHEVASADVDRFHHALVVVRYAAGTTEGTAVGVQSLGGDSSDKKNRIRRNAPLATPFFVDFCPPEGSKLDRRTKGKSGSDLLVKAVAPGKIRSSNRNGAVVYDLTAGFGQDSLILAQNGASHVHMIERDPIVAALLQDALDRLKLISQSDDSRQDTASDLLNRLSLQVGEAAEAVKNSPLDIPPPDCMYLDPMFAPRTKSSAVKKNMQILHGLLNSQEIDETDVSIREMHLLEVAIEAAACRVVVKRPIQALPLGGTTNSSIRKPSHEIKGSVNRWDVYVK